MKSFISLFLVIILLFAFTACSTHIHKIGQGAQRNDETTARQWYILWGLVPLNTVDTHEIAGNATNYEIKTEISGLDFIMNIFTGFVTVYSRTVTVTK